jgi:hypothetical protein
MHAFHTTFICQETPGSCQVISSLGDILRLGWNGAWPHGGALWVGELVAFCWVAWDFCIVFVTLCLAQWILGPKILGPNWALIWA